MQEILILRDDAASSARVEIARSFGTIPRGYVGKIIGPGESYQGRTYEAWYQHLGATVALEPLPRPAASHDFAAEPPRTWREPFTWYLFAAWFFGDLGAGIAFQGRLQHAIEGGVFATAAICYGVLSWRDTLATEVQRRGDRLSVLFLFAIAALRSIYATDLPGNIQFMISCSGMAIIVAALFFYGRRSSTRLS